MNFIPIDAKIITSNIKEIHYENKYGGYEKTQIEIEYIFTVDNEYRSYKLFTESIYAKTDKYRENRHIQIYYNPKNPNDNISEKKN